MLLLAATDLSARSDLAVQRAASIAAERASRLAILHVVDDDQPPELIDVERQQCLALLETQALHVGANGSTPPEVIVVAGDPYNEIVTFAEERGTDLIVVGRHRKRLLRDFIAGTTVERVLSIGTRPVLVVNQQGHYPYRRVMAAVDLSEPSRHALTVARALGFFEDRSLAVVHAFHPFARGKMIQADVPQDRIDKYSAAERSSASARLDSFLARTGLDGHGQRIVVEGPATAAIADAVTRVRPQLLVVGTRGHGRLRGALLGSVAQGVLNRVECDVLAVPPPSG